MQPSVYRISLDVHDAHSGVCLDMKRQDTARQISITLTDGGFPYQISEECYAIFTATKADGHIIAHPCEIRGNTILYDVHAQTTAAVGLAECEIKLYGADDKLITSPGFNILVSSTSYTEGDMIESEDHVSVLGHLISEATTVITEGKAVNAEAKALIEDMNAKRETLEQQIADTAEHAATAKKMALLAAQDRQAASDAANLATSKANEAKTSADNAEESAEKAGASEQQAVRMANAALNERLAAEAAADRAEAVAARVESGELDGKDGATYTPHVRDDGYLEWRNNAGMPNPQPVYIRGPQGEPGTGGLPLPPAAAVGQFIVVSAVDDNGKVTATDAVTLADAEGVGF